MTVSDLLAILERAMPVRGADFELSLDRSESEPPVFEADDGGLLVRVMLCTLHAEDGSVRDSKQQELYFLPPALRAPDHAPRAEAYVRGWLRALPARVAAMPYPVEAVMPHDLLVPAALNDVDLHTEADFAAAFADAERVARWDREGALSELREALARWGIEDRAEEFAALSRPAIHLAYPSRIYQPDEGDEEDEDDNDATPVGSTRLGGEPDLPPSVAWPCSGDRPMTFAAQLDLADLAQFPAACELPREGLLSFFYDAAPDSDSHAHPEYPSRVLYIPPHESLERRATPSDGDRRPEFSVEPLALSDTVPPLESPFYEALLPIDRVMNFRRALSNHEPFEDPLDGLPDFLSSWRGNDADDEYAHQVLGYCRPHQGDPYLAAELDSAGRGWDGWVEGSREAVETARSARRWRLLLQLNAMCEDELLFEQDCGYLYFFIPEDALAEKDWSRVVCGLQCS